MPSAIVDMVLFLLLLLFFPLLFLLFLSFLLFLLQLQFFPLLFLPFSSPSPDEWRHYIPDYVVNRDHPCSFSCSLEIEMPSAIVDMASPTHTIKWERGGQTNFASASFWHDTEPMGKDLVLKM
jgi:hypothetical protein